MKNTNVFDLQERKTNSNPSVLITVRRSTDLTEQPKERRYTAA